MPRLALALVTASVATIAGCSEDPFSGDPFPIHIDRTSGAVLVSVKRGDEEPRVAVLDVLAPITVLDRGPDAPVRRRAEQLTVLGQGSTDPSVLVPRARLGVDVFELHPCAEAECTVGTPDRPRPIRAILGADALAGDAVRFDFARNDVYILPDIAGEDSARGRLCDSVIQTPFRGGGTLLVDGAEVPFGGRRIALGTCLAPPAYAVQGTDLKTGGGDALLVLSTGIGITVLSMSAYTRLTEVLTGAGEAPPPQMGPSTAVLLPSGPVSGWLGSVKRLALVASTGSNPRAPCTEVYAHRLLVERDCLAGELNCPCRGSSCGAPAVVELEPPTGDAIPVLVVPDTDPTLQSLRAELRPDQAEVDGILGTDALLATQIDVDYPHNRVLMRCSDRTRCLARPQLVDTTVQDRRRVLSCLSAEVPDAGVPDAGMPDADLPDAGLPDIAEPGAD